jgi:abortive infection alpha-like protein
MNDALDPTGGWAKATEATAKASNNAIEASRELGHFIRGPASELVGMLEDHLKVVRFERLVRLWARVRNILTEKGMDGPTRRIALNIGIPLLENATLEEDDDLQEVWARLLVNGGDANSGIELRRAFVSVLAEMSARDVRNLAQIELAVKLNAESASTGVWTYELPERAIPFVNGDRDRHEREPSPEVEISLSNLDRLGCIITSLQTPLGPGYQQVNLTPFGRALIEACTR